MCHYRAFLGVIAITLLVGANGGLGAPLKSGPQVGQELPGPFLPLVATGDSAGKRESLEERYGSNPVVMIFARRINDSLTSLVKRIDAETAKNKGARMASFVVFLSDDDKLYDSLPRLAAKERIKHTILAFDSSVGPKAYKVAKEADVTVVSYVRRKVVANHAFRKGELNPRAIESILADIPRILPAKDGHGNAGD
jgi:hypothetical protein